MEGKSLKILDDLKRYESNTMEDNIRNRLDKVLNLYLNEVWHSYMTLLSKVKSDYLYKELMKSTTHHLR